MPTRPLREPEFRVLGAPNPARNASELAQVIREQRGLVTRSQCLGAGMTAKAARWRLERGVWVRVHPGVYQTQPGREDWFTTALAGQLAVPGSAWSHRTAGHLHGLVDAEPRLIELVVDEGRRVVDPIAVKVHRRVDADTHVDPLHWPWRVCVEETVLDLAELGTPDDALAVLGRAFQRRMTTQAALRSRLAARSRHRRRRLLTVVLADVADGAESAMELRFVRDVERPHALPAGRRQAPSIAQGLRLHDVAYDQCRVLVELDGRLGHDGVARVGDGIRDRRSATQGWLTVRAFWRDVSVAPCELAVELSGVFASRGWRGAPHPCRRRACAVRKTPAGGLWPR